MGKQRIAVIGVGTVGAQTLWHLSKSNNEVVGFELFEPGHPHGAAGGESRLFRRIELEDLRYQPIVDRADLLWRDLEKESGQRLRDISGALVFGVADSAAMKCALKSAENCGGDAVVLSLDEVAAQYPAYRILDGEIAILEKCAGTIFPERAIRAASTVAKNNGVEIRTGVRVQKIRQTGEQVEVTLEDAVETFDKVIVSAGAWTPTLFPRLSGYFAPRRLVSAWFNAKNGRDVSDLMPYIRTEPHYSYGLPAADGTSMKLGLGFAHHVPIKDPESAELQVKPEDLLPLRDLATEFFTDLESYPTRVNAYFEAYTRSRVEYIQAHPEMGRVLIMAGFSGKGFKSSPAIGEIGARWALEKEQENASSFITDFKHQEFE